MTLWEIRLSTFQPSRPGLAPAVTVYLSGAAAEPLQLKAPVSIFSPITRVESFTDRGFPPVGAQLERGFLGQVSPARRATANASLPQLSYHDQTHHSLPSECHRGHSGD
ncbi:hypothetical protein GOODEAATRI_028722 [Goodea atripinnis]|uniref:Uncharacterized protein n=1 Tax=Goodea atripinnis TaxID=208336 RepID=A0ABV0MLK4_9TELE